MYYEAMKICTTVNHLSTSCRSEFDRYPPFFRANGRSLHSIGYMNMTTLHDASSGTDGRGFLVIHDFKTG